jgi:hypothetical protein
LKIKDNFINWRSQIVISSWGGIRKMPLAFTEQGVAMLSGHYSDHHGFSWVVIPPNIHRAI